MVTQDSKPNLSDTYQPSIYAAAIITYMVATSAVILRFVARRLTNMKLWYDDWLVVVAWVRQLKDVRALMDTNMSFSLL